MPNTKPKFDPNKPYVPVSETVKPPFNPNKEFTQIAEPSKSSGTDYSAITEPTGLEKANQIIDNIPDLDTGKKDILKDITARQAPNDVIKNSILTLQNAHPNQDGYYVDNKTGVPIPLTLGQKPPQGHDVASVWGTQAQAEDDSFMPSFGKSLFNGIVGAVQGYASLSEIATGSLSQRVKESMIADMRKEGVSEDVIKQAESHQTGQFEKNLLNSLKFNKASNLKEMPLNTEGITSYEDILDPKRWDWSPKKIQGLFLQGVESITAFAVGRGGGLAGKGAQKLISGSSLATGAGAATQRALSAVSSYNLSANQMMDVADEAGLKGDNKLAFAGITALPLAAIELSTGLSKLFTDNAIARNAVNGLTREVIGGLERDASGLITRESLHRAYTDMTKGATAIALTTAKTMGKTVLGEGAEEAAQGLTTETSKMLYDKIQGEGVFNADALSPKSVANYVNETIGGMVGAFGPSLVGARRSVAIANTKARSENAFEIAKGGEKSIINFQQNIDAAVQRGDITQEEGDAAKFKVNAYAEYHTQTQDKNLSDEQKRKAFDLSFQISALQNEIPTDKAEIEKMNPIDKSEVEVRKKMRDDLQKELTETIMADQVQAEPVVAHETLNRVEHGLSTTRNLTSRHGDLTEASNEENLSHTTRTSLQKEADELYQKLMYNFETRKQELIGQGKTAQEAADILHPLAAQTEMGKRIDEIEALLKREHTNEEKTNPSPNIIKNLDEVIEKGSGRLIINHNGRHIDFNTFDVAIDKEGKTAEVVHVEKKDPTANKGVGMEAYIELGNRLAKKGVTLESMGQAQHPQGKKLWDKLVSKGHAIRTTQGRYRFIVKSDKVEKSDRRKNAKKFDDKDENGTFEFNKQKPLEKKEIIHDYLDEHPELNNELEGHLEQGQNNKWHVNIGGRYIQLARNIVPDKYTGDRKNFPLGKEVIKGSQGESLMRYTQPVGVRLVSIIGDKGARKGKRLRVLSIYNKQTGNHIVFGQERERGKSDYNEKEIAQLQEIINTNHLTAETELHNPVFTEPQNNEPLPAQSSKEQFIEAGINSLKEGGNYDESLDKVYRDQLSAQYDKINEQPELTESDVADELEKELAREQVFAETGQFQKESAVKGNIEKVMAQLKKSFPKVNVVYDENLKAAAKVVGNTITINPYYAGIDTPIHEYGHILIDSIGYGNKVIQSAIKQLKDTPLWADVAKNYSELSEENLGKEVLAQAIGIEGAGIFDKTIEQSKFKTFLNYIFDKLKSLLGVNKNIAKSLSRQIIAGIGTKEITGQNETEQFAKVYESLEDMSQATLIRKLTMSFENYRQDVLGKNLAQERKDIQFLNDRINTGVNEQGVAYTPEEIGNMKSLVAEFKKNEAEDKSKWMAYREDVGQITSIVSEKRFEDLSDEKLIEMYNLINNNYQDKAKDADLKSIMVHIAMNLFNRQKEILSKQKGFSEEKASNQDLSDYREIKLKVLSHFTESFPDLQALSKIWDEAYFAKTKESKAKKLTNEKLGLAVIEETNKRLGITERLKNGLTGFAFPAGRKYFNFLDNKGKLITLSEAKAKGLSKAQVEYLKFVRELQAERMGLVGDPNIYDMNMELLKIDKSFSEAYKTQGIVQAFSNFLGNSYNINNVRIAFTNLNNGKSEITEFGNIEKALIAYGNNGILERGKAMALLAKYNSKARKQLKTGTNVDNSVNPLTVIKGGDYTLDTNGQLINKFDRKRSYERGYSQDFYKAVTEYIDDSAHVKHISPLMPIINSIEHLNKTGVTIATTDGEKTIHAPKPRVVEWIKEWKNLHIFKEKDVTTPELDASLKFLRFMTSATTMLFNVPAGVMNFAIGVYNNWRAENGKMVVEGLKRLFSNPKYTVDLMNKYGAVSNDIDSNPMMTAGGIFFKLGHAMTKWGEIMIQSSMVAGQMSKEDFDSFEYKEDSHGVKHLVLKSGMNEKEIEKKMQSYINRTSDIQGKYSDKDTRNIMNNELGKATMQFRVWMPDAFKMRFGNQYINRDGKVIKSSFRGLVANGFEDIRKDINDKGFAKGLWENKEFMSNLKGLIAISFMMMLSYRNDDDEKKRKGSALLERALSDMLFVFDPNNLKFTISRPMPALATLGKFIDAGQHLFAIDADDYDKHGNPKIIKDIIDLTPGGKRVSQIADFVTED